MLSFASNGDSVSNNFTSVGKFEQRRNGSVWEFRPNKTSARRLAIFHSGCVTLFAIPVLVGAFGMFAFFVFSMIVFFFNKVLNENTLTIIAWIFTALAIVGGIPILIVLAKHIFRKSLRDNGQTMQVSPGGPILLGERILVEAGTPKHVTIRTVETSDGEGGTTINHFADVVEHQESAAPIPIPIPCQGMWNDSVLEKPDAEKFAGVLASALGIAVV